MPVIKLLFLSDIHNVTLKNLWGQTSYAEFDFDHSVLPLLLLQQIKLNILFTNKNTLTTNVTLSTDDANTTHVVLSSNITLAINFILVTVITIFIDMTLDVILVSNISKSTTFILLNMSSCAVVTPIIYLSLLLPLGLSFLRVRDVLQPYFAR